MVAEGGSNSSQAATSSDRAAEAAQAPESDRKATKAPISRRKPAKNVARAKVDALDHTNEAPKTKSETKAKPTVKSELARPPNSNAESAADISRLATPSASALAFRELAKAVRPYAPINREPGVHTRFGASMVNGEATSHPLTQLGVLAVATDLIKLWEGVVGNEYRRMVGNETKGAGETPSITSAGHASSSQGGIFMPEKQQHETLESQSIASAKTPNDAFGLAQHSSAISKKSQSNVIINRQYIHQLELENFTYRRHLHHFESDIAERLAGVLEGVLQGKLGPDGVPKMDTKKGNTSKNNEKRVGSETGEHRKLGETVEIGQREGKKPKHV
ncbi:MAG: Ureidoglycolate lyase [Chaenotheca gracillima]|nr:MAG: Ureidoglycolate lyase [Chaenotheca gracillima]